MTSAGPWPVADLDTGVRAEDPVTLDREEADMSQDDGQRRFVYAAVLGVVLPALLASTVVRDLEGGVRVAAQVGLVAVVVAAAVVLGGQARQQLGGVRR